MWPIGMAPIPELLTSLLPIRPHGHMRSDLSKALLGKCMEYMIEAKQMQKWDVRFCELARYISAWSKVNRPGFAGDRRVWRYAARAERTRFRL